MFRSRAVYIGNNRVLAKTARGLKMFVDSRDVSIAPHIILDGVWEEGTEAVVRAIVKPGMSVLEIGANVGYFTLVMAQAVGSNGHVVAFEADPDLAQLVRDNVEVNGFIKQALVHNLAVSDVAGELRFHRALHHRGNGTILAGFDQTPHNPEVERETIAVRAVTLDEAIAGGERPQPDFIKMDAEGAESAIVRGAARTLASQKTRVWMFEFFPRFVAAAGDEPRAFLERFQSAGYSLSRVDERKRKLQPVTIESLLAGEMSEVVATR